MDRHSWLTGFPPGAFGAPGQRCGSPLGAPKRPAITDTAEEEEEESKKSWSEAGWGMAVTMPKAKEPLDPGENKDVCLSASHLWQRSVVSVGVCPPG